MSQERDRHINSWSDGYIALTRFFRDRGTLSRDGLAQSSQVRRLRGKRFERLPKKIQEMRKQEAIAGHLTRQRTGALSPRATIIDLSVLQEKSN